MVLKADKGEVTQAERYALRELPDCKPPDLYSLGWQTSLRNTRAQVLGKRDVHQTWANNGNEESRIYVKVLDEVLAIIKEEIELMERMG